MLIKIKTKTVFSYVLEIFLSRNFLSRKGYQVTFCNLYRNLYCNKKTDELARTRK